MKKVNADSVAKWTIGLSLIAIGGIFATKAIKSVLDKKKQENAGNLIDSTDQAKAQSTVLAQRAYAAMFRAGATWFADGTDEDELYKVATSLFRQRIPFATFTDIYKKLYPGRNFVSDLQSELSSSELEEFYDHLKGIRSLQGLLHY